jgi:DNA-binding Lrp family transcriptional regulator
MAVKAYLLIETQVGKTTGVIQAICGLEGVISADAVTGPYDAIAAIEGETLSEIGHIITDKIHSIRGVTRSVACVALEIS